MLTLSISGLSVNLEKFTNDELPRSRVSAPATEYSAAGNSVGFGPAFESKFVWAGTVVLSATDAATLQLIYDEAEYQRLQGSDNSVLVNDLTQQYQERAPRSRAIVPATSETAIAPNWVRYYAQFRARFTEPLKTSITGKICLVTFAMTEADLVPAV